MDRCINEKSSSKKQLYLALEGALICRSSLPTALPKLDEQINICHGIVARPGLRKFLDSVIKHYDLHTYSSNQKECTEAALTTLGVRSYFTTIMDKTTFKKAKKMSFESIDSLSQSQSSRIFVDDSLNQFIDDLSQALVIQTFNGDPSDEELLKITPFLIELASHSDVRPVAVKYERYNQDFLLSISKSAQNDKSNDLLQCFQDEIIQAKPELSQKVRKFILERKMTERDELNPKMGQKISIGLKPNNESESSSLQQPLTPRSSFQGFLSRSLLGANHGVNENSANSEEEAPHSESTLETRAVTTNS